MKKVLLFILIPISFCAITSYALADPPANDDCIDATDAGTLSAGMPVQLSGSLIDATNDCQNVWYPEVWIKFTITSFMDVTIDYCDDANYLFEASSVLFSDCPCGSAIDYSLWDHCPLGNPSYTWYGLSAGTYYYPIGGVWGSTEKAGSYTINITGDNCPPPPANDDCANAISVSEVTDQSYSTRGATFDGTGTCLTSGNIWYVYTPSFTGTARISLDPSYSSRVTAYDGYSCLPLPSQLGCEESEIDFAVVTGQQYLLEIGGSDSSVGDGTFTIREAPESPANDDCADATDAGTLVDGNTVQLSGSLIEATVDCQFNYVPEVWVKFTLNSCMDVTIDFCDYEEQFYGAPMYLYADCPCDDGMVSYNNSYNCELNGNPIMTWQGLEAGTYYYAIYYEFFLNTDAYDSYVVNITGTDCPLPPANDNCSDAIAIGEVTDYGFTTRSATYDGSGSCITEGANVWFVYTPSFTGDARINLNGSEFNTVFAVYDGATCSPLPFEIDCTEEPSMDYIVVSGQQYLIEIGASNEETGAGVLTIGEVPDAPPNDNCENADDGGVLISDSTVQFTGTTAGATQDCVMNYYPEVWIKFTVPSCMDITIDFCENEGRIWELAENLYYDCSCYDSRYANGNDYCDNDNPILNFYGVESGTYYYSVYAVDGGSPYTVNITGVDCPLPPEPDFIVTAPYTGTSTTCGAGDDCRIPYAGEDQLYEVTISTDGNWLFSLCNSQSEWESAITLGTSPCGWDIDLENQDCENWQSAGIAYGLDAGTYYLNIDASGISCGEYTLDILEIPGPCDNSYYTNGNPDYADAIASYRTSGETGVYYACDDFTITEDITLESINFMSALYSEGFVYFDGTGDYMILSDDGGAPGSILYEGTEVQCDEVSTGRLYHGMDEVFAYQFDNLDIELAAGTYFLACRTISSPNYWLTTDSQAGTTAFYMDDINTNWTPSGVNADLAFCLLASTNGGDFEYLPGDANMAAGSWPPNVIGADVTYLVNYFRAIAAPCLVGGFYNSADANGDCSVIGADVTYLVQYFRGANELHFCPDYEPAWQSSGDLPAEAPSGWPNCETPSLLNDLIVPTSDR